MKTRSVDRATFLIIATILLSGTSAGSDVIDDSDPEPEVGGKAKVMYKWQIVEYEWPSASHRQAAQDDGSYKPKNSAINGIKLYKNRVFVTVPRLKDGVPSTLNEVVENTDTSITSESHVLRPYPSWEMQTLGNCSALQRVQSMEIDPSTGHMWIVDTGYVPNMENLAFQPLEACPAKILVWDLRSNTEIRRYHFPATTIGVGLFYLNDVVLEIHNGAARFAYMSDTLDYKLVVYDFLKDESFAYSHPNMRNDKRYENITISNITLTNIITGINGIAMSPDFKYLYYSSVTGVGLHQIETGVLREARGNDKAFAASVRTVGNKVSPGDGMAYGAKNNLYYSSLGLKSVYKWDIKKDMATSGLGFADVQLKSQTALVSDPRMEWIDTLAVDDCGYLWFTTSRLHKFFSHGVDQSEENFFIWKVFVDDYNYLDPDWHRGGDVSGARGVWGVGAGWGMVVVMAGMIVGMLAVRVGQ